MTTLISILAALMLVSSSDAPAWNVDIFRDASTIQFYTVNPAGEGHWSRVWVVVIDGAPYIRLGSQATSRINGNANAPYLNIKVGGQEFDHVMAQSAPDMKAKVQAAMADKYWLDFLVRNEDHPLTMRLVPSPEPPH
jgi:hypothetical protein